MTGEIVARPALKVLPSLKKVEDIAGGRDALADRLGVSKSTIAMWHHRKSVPADWLGELEAVTRRKVTVYQLLADVRAARAAKAAA